MANIKAKTSSNVFYKARCVASTHNEQLKSREGAADIMSIDRGRLYRIESGLVNTYPEEVLLMADLYNAPELKNFYCREVCPLGDDVPEISLCGLDRITIKALSALKDIDDIKESLLDITADGKITKDEIPKLNEIINELDELNAITQSLKVWAEKNLEEG